MGHVFFVLATWAAWPSSQARGIEFCCAVMGVTQAGTPDDSSPYQKGHGLGWGNGLLDKQSFIFGLYMLIWWQFGHGQELDPSDESLLIETLYDEKCSFLKKYVLISLNGRIWVLGLCVSLLYATGIGQRRQLKARRERIKLMILIFFLSHQTPKRPTPTILPIHTPVNVNCSVTL